MGEPGTAIVALSFKTPKLHFAGPSLFFSFGGDSESEETFFCRPANGDQPFRDGSGDLSAMFRRNWICYQSPVLVYSCAKRDPEVHFLST